MAGYIIEEDVSRRQGEFGKRLGRPNHHAIENLGIGIKGGVVCNLGGYGCGYVINKDFPIRGTGSGPGDVPAVGIWFSIVVGVIGNLKGTSVIIGVVEENFPVAVNARLPDNISASGLGIDIFIRILCNLRDLSTDNA